MYFINVCPSCSWCPRACSLNWYVGGASVKRTRVRVSSRIVTAVPPCLGAASASVYCKNGRMQSVRVPGFEPSTSGLHFPNYYPHEPCVQLPLPDGQVVGVGDANGGLCGGMAFAARDYFELGRSPPADTTAPAEGTPLFSYLVDRL